MRKQETEINVNDRKTLLITGLSFVSGVFLLALCYNLFFLPNNLVVGGMSGLAIIMKELTGLNTQIFIYVSSFLLLIVSFIFLGWNATKKTVIGTFLYPIFITFTKPIADVILPHIVFHEMIVTIILAALLYGFSSGLIYKFGYTTGGSDVLVKLGVKYLHLSEGKGVLLFNGIIIVTGGFVFGVEMAVYAIIILVIGSLIVDKILIGISDSKKFMIYTKKSKKVKTIIEEEFKTGYTIFPTVGGYSHVNGDMIMCVISNRDVNMFKDKILEIDPHAFFVISDCYEVQGGVKRSNLPFI